MASTFTTNKAVEQPAAGDYVGTWATPANSNYSVIDQAFGAIYSIDLTAGSIVLSTAQARAPFLNFVGTPGANRTVTVPGLSTSPGTVISGGFYTVQNRCANSSAFIVTLLTTVVGQEFVSLPPGEAVDVMVEGTGSSQAGSIKFRNMDRVGTYWDYAGSSVPSWVLNCVVAPYLLCDGSAFSSATYPVLATILGGTTLPDARGRFRATLNSGTGRITSGSSAGGVDGNTLFASGGSQVSTLSSQNMPPVAITDPGHTHSLSYQQVSVTIPGGGGAANFLGGVTTVSTTGSATTGITAGSASPTSFSNLPPTYISGITLIRAG